MWKWKEAYLGLLLEKWLKNLKTVFKLQKINPSKIFLAILDMLMFE